MLLQRYYSDSQLQVSSKATPHNFISPLGPISNQHSPSSSNNTSSHHQHSPSSTAVANSLLRGSPRHPPFSLLSSSSNNGTNNTPRPTPFPPSPLALKSSPVTTPSYNHKTLTISQSPHNPNLLRSPITPRGDRRNAAILPPSSPNAGVAAAKYRGSSSAVPCSPMGPVGRSLLASPASPRSPIDLSLRPPSYSSAASRFHGKSPLASRSLNLPPSPVTSTDSSQSPKPLQLLSSGGNNPSTSPLLRAYLANNKSHQNGATATIGSGGNSLFKPLVPHADKSNNITVIGLLSDSGSATTTTTPPATPKSGPKTPKTLDKDYVGIEGIYRLPPSSDTHHQHEEEKPESLIKLPSIETPMDFSRLLNQQSTTSSSSQQQLQQRLGRGGGGRVVRPSFSTAALLAPDRS